LHGQIARVIEERWPDTEATEPELLAYHYTGAKQPERAIPLWQRAGNLALKRMARAEAIAHLNKGLELVTALPPSAERDVRELDLRILLGTVWIALRGWPAQEVWDSFLPALGLATSLRRDDALVPILWGLFIHVLCRGRIAESLRWVAQLMNAAETYGDPDLQIVGHHAAVVAYFWLGDPIKTREHADRFLVLYSEERHVHLVGSLNVDPKSANLFHSAQSIWMLGYPEQALRINDATAAHSRQVGHPFALAWALTVGAALFDYLGEPDEWLKRIEEAGRVACENSLPFFMECVVPIWSGMALIRKGQTAEGIASLERGLVVWKGVWKEGGGRVASPHYKSVLAEGMAQIGDLAGALDLIDEVIAQVERPGWEERHYYAEALRIKGWLLSLNGDPAGAERAYIASLDWARQQQAKSWELRTANSYARLLRDQRPVREAYDLLAPIYAWFTEGFATKDLKDARALLEELADAPAVEPVAPAS
jgi:predicted ATPase